MKQVLMASAALLIGIGSAFAATTDQTGSTANPPASMHRTTDSGRIGTAANGTASAVPGAGAVSGDVFATIPAQEDLSSKVVGLDIYNNTNQDIGKIKDIVAVGGFLGMDDHYVAVKPSAVDISYDSNAKKWQAKMNTNAAQLKAAPEYKYSSND
jgi:hypothetical protein